MRTFLLLCLLTGCYPIPEHDCITDGGLYVRGSDDCAGIGILQQRIEDKAAELGFTQTLAGVLLYVRTTELTESGTFVTGRGGYAGGITYCDGPEMIVARGPAVMTWEQTAFAHESFHVFQGCPYTIGAEDPWHAGWADKIYPAITEINGAADAVIVVAP